MLMKGHGASLLGHRLSLFHSEMKNLTVLLVLPQSVCKSVILCYRMYGLDYATITNNCKKSQWFNTTIVYF